MNRNWDMGYAKVMYNAELNVLPKISYIWVSSEWHFIPSLRTCVQSLGPTEEIAMSTYCPLTSTLPLRQVCTPIHTHTQRNKCKMYFKICCEYSKNRDYWIWSINYEELIDNFLSVKIYSNCREEGSVLGDRW